MRYVSIRECQIPLHDATNDSDRDPPTFRSTCTLLLDCAVCSPGYATTLPYHCNKCLEKTSLGIFVVAILASIVVCFLVCCMLSIGGHRNTGCIIASIEAIMSLQSFKILLVSWQIVTQVRGRNQKIFLINIFCL